MASPISGQTRLAVVIGDPVRHSRSPAIHNAGFDAIGFDAVYLAMPVAPGDAPFAVEAMRRHEWLGMSITMPHKEQVMSICDRATPVAQQLGAANCVFWDDGELVAHNTDGAGFVRGLEADLGVDPRGFVCGVVGAGGAARAVGLALVEAGASRVLFINRTHARAEAAVDMVGGTAEAADESVLGELDLVVNATPVGMGEGPAEQPFDPAPLSDRAIVSDLIYHPAETPLLRTVASRGLRHQNGVSMLLFQAVEAFERWTGAAAPVQAMRAALSASLD